MDDQRQAIPVVGLLLTMVVAAYMVVQLQAQVVTTNDFTNAAMAEVRDAQGQVVLSGAFKPADQDEEDEQEIKATLAPTGADTDAAGEAEVEWPTANPADHEVEFSVRNLAAGGQFTFVIDGKTVATATADRRGRAEVELDARNARAAPSR
jgi:hypothetical protein